MRLPGVCLLCIFTPKVSKILWFAKLFSCFFRCWCEKSKKKEKKAVFCPIFWVKYTVFCGLYPDFEMLVLQNQYKRTAFLRPVADSFRVFSQRCERVRDSRKKTTRRFM